MGEFCARKEALFLMWLLRVGAVRSPRFFRPEALSVAEKPCTFAGFRRCPSTVSCTVPERRKSQFSMDSQLRTHLREQPPEGLHLSLNLSLSLLNSGHCPLEKERYFCSEVLACNGVIENHVPPNQKTLRTCPERWKLAN